MTNTVLFYDRPCSINKAILRKININFAQNNDGVPFGDVPGTMESDDSTSIGLRRGLRAGGWIRIRAAG